MPEVVVYAEGGRASRGILAPFLEQAHPLTPAVRAPQVAPARAVVAAVVGPVVAVPSASHTRPSKKVN